MELSPDQMVFWQWRWVRINATLVYSWVVMAVLVSVSWWVTRNLQRGGTLSRGQNALESVVYLLRNQIREIIGDDPDPYLPFIGSLFLFISTANLMVVIPGFQPPTGSLTTTVALSVCVFFAVPIYGIARRGLLGYLRRYIEPSPLMLPFHVIGEVSRTISLAIRLFGNIMSGTLMVAILLSIAPLFFPVLLQALGLLIGQIQAYIFAVLATVYIASATRARRENDVV